jgi:hypothetical protein
MTTLTAVLLALCLFGGILLCLEAGLRIGLRRGTSSDGAGPGFVALAGALFALLGLLVAFTFSGAAGRFESKRHLIIEEANAIEAAYLRIDLLPAGAQPALRESFRRYLDARLAVYAKMPDMRAAEVEISRAEALRLEIWAQAVAACREIRDEPATVALVISSLNAVIDIGNSRTAALEIHMPGVIFALLAAVSLACSFLAGFDAAGRKRRSWAHALGFAAVLATTFYMILDLEYPRVGLIRFSAADQVLIHLRHGMK